MKIMIWNAQHFDNQSGGESQAYLDKWKFLCTVLSKENPDIVVLLEAGKTGCFNKTIVEPMNTFHFSLFTYLTNDGAMKIDTTLGIIVFIKSAIADKFEKCNYVLSPKERRGCVLLKHKETKQAFSFYHANASCNALENIVDSLNFIGQNRLALGIKELVFFGGDLNLNAKPMDNNCFIDVLIAKEPSGLYDRVFYNKVIYHRLLPISNHIKGVAFTHSNLSSGKMSTLDYAYVLIADDWTAFSDGQIFYDPKIGCYRCSYGIQMRSDHFPVIYTYNKIIF